MEMSLGILSMKSPGAINLGRPLGTEPVILTPTAKKYQANREERRTNSVRTYTHARTQEIDECVSSTLLMAEGGICRKFRGKGAYSR